jgi:hypothetical protein
LLIAASARATIHLQGDHLFRGAAVIEIHQCGTVRTRFAGFPR